MHIETERKFLVRNEDYKALAVKRLIMAQGYLASDGGRTVRVRASDDKGYLTVKGPSADGISRSEWEYAIPVTDALEMMKLCEGIVEKTRWIVPAGGGRVFEVDEFHGDNDGLVEAEIELGSPDEEFARPEWLGKEVTGDRRYYNSSLARLPFTKWAE